MAVELRYRLTVVDFEEALRVRAFRTPTGLVEVLIAPLMTVVAMIVLAVGTDVRPLALGVSAVVALGIVCWGVARQLRTAARRTAGFVEPYGLCRTLVDERGAVSTGERASSSCEWSMFREYVETPGLFVLLGGDGAVGLAVLPKRGARSEADVARVRGILERSLKGR
ncbi:YcxB family protein [Streptomyces sp. NPDC093252]|uniref:YcxB family protein n=1 Tax=Streptomyces sp. NPDC093252 TaxID=3154980 RepID=UPI00342FB74B